MSENESNQTSVDRVEVAAEKVVTGHKKTNKIGIYIGALLTVVVIIAGVLFVMEKEGRSSTHLFTKIIENTPVAVVNGQKITQKELAATPPASLYIATISSSVTSIGFSANTVSSNF